MFQIKSETEKGWWMTIVLMTKVGIGCAQGGENMKADDAYGKIQEVESKG